MPYALYGAERTCLCQSAEWSYVTGPTAYLEEWQSDILPSDLEHVQLDNEPTRKRICVDVLLELPIEPFRINRSIDEVLQTARRNNRSAKATETRRAENISRTCGAYAMGTPCPHRAIVRLR